MTRDIGIEMPGDRPDMGPSEFSVLVDLSAEQVKAKRVTLPVVKIDPESREFGYTFQAMTFPNEESFSRWLTMTENTLSTTGSFPASISYGLKLKKGSDTYDDGT